MKIFYTMKTIYVFVIGLALLPLMAPAQTIGVNQYLVWGIGSEEITIPTGFIIVDAILTIENVTPENAICYVHILDNTDQGLFIGQDRYYGNYFEPYGIPLEGYYENGNLIYKLSTINTSRSSIYSIFSNPCVVTLPNSSSITLSSAILELMDFAGNGGGFGIGIDAFDTCIDISSIRLDMTLKSLTQTAPDSILTFSFGNPGMNLYQSWDFQDSSMSGWNVVDEGSIDGPSRWMAFNGELVQIANIFSAEESAEVRKKGTYLVYPEGMALNDYQVDFDMRSADDDAIGLIFRFKDNDNYYRFSWDKQRSYRRLVKNTGGVFTVLAQDAVPYVTKQNYQVTVKAVGSLITVLIDGETIFSVNDTSLNSGTIAMYSWGNTGAYYDNISVSVYR